MSRSLVALSMVCLLGLGAGSAALAQSPTPSFIPPGPPYPEPLEGVSVYDHAGVLRSDTIAALEATIDALEARTGLGIVVYTQVKPESDTSEEAAADAAALADQWGLGQDLIGDDLVILLDLTPDRCHGQVQLYVPQDLPFAYLGDEERQGIFDREMLPLLQVCDIDGSLLAATAAIEAASVAFATGLETADPSAAAPSGAPSQSAEPAGG